MSDFIEAMVELLPEHNNLKNKNNLLRKILDRSVGAWFDEHNVLDFYDQLFLDTATGKWLDLHGKDYGVYRKPDESDDVFRNRIIMEKNDNLTPDYLQDIYNVGLYAAFDGFNPVNNDLTSDNPYLTDWYMGVADADTQSILDKKFIIDNTILWWDGGYLDYIYNTSDEGVLKDYLNFYKIVTGSGFFELNTDIERVKLTSSRIKSGAQMFGGCTNLVSVELDFPNITSVSVMFDGCSNLTDAIIRFPKWNKWHALANCFSSNCYSLERIDATVGDDIKDTFKNKVLDLNLPNLESFIVNGEEVDLS